MNRDQMIAWLVANSDSWKGAKAQVVLNSMEDAHLKLVLAGEQRRQTIENALVQPITLGESDDPVRLKLSLNGDAELEAEVLAENDDEDEADDDAEDDGDDDEDEADDGEGDEEEDEVETPATNKRVKVKAKPSVVNAGKKKAMDPEDEADGGDDEEEEGEPPMKKMKENFAAWMKGLSEKEWLELSPPRIRAATLNAIGIEREAKSKEVDKLVANLSSQSQPAMRKKLMGKSIEELRELISLLPPTKNKAESGDLDELFLAPQPLSMMAENEGGDEAPLDVPTWNSFVEAGRKTA